MTITLKQLLDGLAVVPTDLQDLRVTGITADSRAVKPGFVFAALPGTVVDGATYIAQAFEKGAVAVLARHGTAGPGKVGQAPVIAVENPRQAFALAASHFYQTQPDLIVAVTGTNGKTSVAAFVRQIWQSMGLPAASIGTIGMVGPSGASYLSHTTPDPVQMHEMLAALKREHVEHVALEASSHGLAQYRLDGVRFAAAAFTNLTRDHMDYHGTVESYFAAKARLFTDLLPAGAPAVINADSDYAEQLIERCDAHGMTVFTVGKAGKQLRLLESRRDGWGQVLRLQTAKGQHTVSLPLVGDFQASNALVAAGLVLATGGEEEQVMHALSSLQGAKGRLDLVSHTAQGAPIFVDYAHTPDALENAILSLRPYTKGRLVVAFGCGGDRDPGKRPLMGAVVSKHADVAIVTDDNPRTEDAGTIRAAALAAAPGALEIADRAQAIAKAVAMLKADDVLLVAGKGHEEGQTIGKTVHPFSDHEAVRAAVRGEAYHG